MFSPHIDMTNRAGTTAAAAAASTSAMRINSGKSSRISWRNVNDLDIDEIRKSNDIETLESYLPNLLDSFIS